MTAADADATAWVSPAGLAHRRPTGVGIAWCGKRIRPVREALVTGVPRDRLCRTCWPERTLDHSDGRGRKVGA